MANIFGLGKNTLIGTSAADRIDSCGGDSTINGGAGDDIIVYYESDTPANIDGGVGLNAIDASNATRSVNIALGLYKNIQKYFGSTFGDKIKGTTGKNVIIAGSGNNQIDGGGGGDSIVGGAGNDTIVYYAKDAAGTIDGGQGINLLDASSAETAVNINLSLYKNIQNVNGSSKGGKLTGTKNANVIKAGNSDTYIDGLGGGDTITGGTGNDTIAFYASDNPDKIDGGAGNNTLSAAKAAAGVTMDLKDYHNILSVIGSAKDDKITGTTGVNTINSGAGKNYIDGKGGGDTIVGGTGNDTIVYYADDKADLINGGGGSDTIDASKVTDAVTIDLSKYQKVQNYLGSAKGDTILGTKAANVITTGNGNNYIDGKGFGDSIICGTGNDTIVYYASDKPAKINGGEGVNILDASGSSTTATINLSLYQNIQNAIGSNKGGKVIGTKSSNVIKAGTGNTYIDGLGGGDTIVGGAGNDTILYYASDKPDNIDGGSGSNTLDASKTSDAVTIDLKSYHNLLNVIGSAKDDTLTGTTAANIINSGTGKNYIDGKGGGDKIIGGAGNDTIVYYANDNAALIDGGSGKNTIDAIAATTAVSVNLGKYKNIQNYTASALGDTIIGSTLANEITGGAGNDIIDGKEGADTINGGAGDDVMTFYAAAAYDGGSGSNTLTAANLKGGVKVDFKKGKIKNIQQVLGSNYADTLTAGADTVTLDGGAGNDTLNGASGNSVLIGGAGNDQLYGGSGKDTYLFDASFGKDTVMDMDGNSSDTIKFGKGINKSDLVITKNGKDLVLKADSTNSLTLKNWYQDSDKINKFEFSDGTTDSITNFNWDGSATTNPGDFNIVFDYSLDTNHFFDDPVRRQVLEEAAADWEQVIKGKFPDFTPNQSLSIYNPSTGAETKVNTNTLTAGVDLTIYVGAHQLATNVLGKGGDFWNSEERYVGAQFQPIVGSIQFDSDTNWYFDTTPATFDVPATAIDFLSVAEHEMGHVLGLGICPQWDKLVDTKNHTFIGQNAEKVYGAVVPLAAGDGHWGEDVFKYNRPLMNPYSSPGYRQVISALDKAGMADIGYTVV